MPDPGTSAVAALRSSPLKLVSPRPHEIRAFEEDDWERLVRYYEAYNGSGYVLTHRPFFDWCFASPFRPDGRHGQRILFATDRSGRRRIVGGCGLMPWPLQVGGERVLGQCPVNLHLNAPYRGRGLGQALLEAASYDLPVTYAGGARPVTFPMFRRFGASLVTRMHRAVRVLDAEVCGGVVRSSPSFMEMDPAVRRRALAAVNAAAEAPGGSAAGFGLERAARFGPEWDEAWAGVRAGYGTTTWRSAAFLNWRYGAYPFAIYETHVLRDGGGRITGFVALREERPAFGAVLRVVDAVAAPGALGALLALVEAEARRRRVAFVDVLSAGGFSKGGG